MHRNHYALLCVFAVGCQCGDGATEALYDPDCSGCRGEGESCTFPINCRGGTVCNNERYEYYDAEQPVDICVTYGCRTDDDCILDRVCTLENLCRAPVCQTDLDCDGAACVGGVCGDTPNASAAVRCVIVSPHPTLAVGDSATLEAIALDADGRVLPRAAFDWSSAATTVATVDGAIVTGVGAGAAPISASVRDAPNVRCSGRVAQVFAPIAPTGERARVVVVDAADGAPIEDAEVTLLADTSQVLRTDGRGHVVTASTATITAVTVTKPGWRSVSILEPGTNDLFVTLPRAPDITRAGGIRGGIDVSANPTIGDLDALVVYHARSPDLFEYRALPAVDIVPTHINLEGLDFDETLPLPGNMVLSFGSREFTRDERRCVGTSPEGLGCFATRAPVGMGAAWVMGGRYKLSTITILQDQLRGFEPEPYDAAARAELIRAFVGLTTGGWFGALPFVEVDDAPRVPIGEGADCSDPAQAIRCRGDFNTYTSSKIALDQRAGLQSVIRAPSQPARPDGGCDDTLVVSLYSALTGRGLVLTGFGSAEDLDDNCIVDGTPYAFSLWSDPIPNGTLPLTTTPQHSGLEGSEQLAVLVAVDRGDDAAPLDLALVAAPVDRVDGAMDLSGQPFLAYPEATIDRARGTATVVDGEGTGLRFTFDGVDGGWIVFAPRDVGAVMLPDSDVVREAAVVTVQAFAGGEYAQTWALASPTRYGRTQPVAVTTTQCGEDRPCTLR